MVVIDEREGRDLALESSAEQATPPGRAHGFMSFQPHDADVGTLAGELPSKIFDISVRGAMSTLPIFIFSLENRPSALSSHNRSKWPG
jgi:hypothetical protein